MKTKMVYLTVAVEIDAEADEREVIENCGLASSNFA